MALEYLLAEAKEARLANDFANALRLVRAYLDQSPEDIDAQSFLGLCLVETGEIEKGRPLIENALNLSPDSPQFLLNAAILRETEGNLREAVVLASKSATLAPDKFEPWGHLGALLGRCGKFAEAVDALENAYKIQPNHIGVIKLLAGASLEVGNLTVAKKAINAYSEIAPNSTDLPILQCSLFRASSDWDNLRLAAEKWLKQDPMSEEARVSLAFALGQTGYFKAATNVYAPLVSMRKPSAMHLAAMGRYFLGARDLTKAEEYFARAVGTDENCTEAHFGLARLNTYLGNLEKAELHCRKALALDPTHAEAYGQLSEITGGKLTGNDLRQLAALISDGTQPPESQSILFFAEGDAWHKRVEPEKAFSAWSKAGDVKISQLRALGIDYNHSKQTSKINTLKNLFREDVGVPLSSPLKTTPIFILGMPRSGTTLLENAIAAHPMVSGAGEIPTMPYIVDQTLNWAKQSGWQGGTLPDDQLASSKEMYLRQALELGASSETPYFTDKQPANFHSPGIIQQLFPTSPMIHIRRSARETAFSIFRKNFTRQWPFANNLEDIAHFYSTYADIMEHWTAIYEEKILFVQYEDLVLNFESNLKRIIDFCGLEWDEACLRYYEQDRSVITFSATQVRKPPSKEHLDSTTPYRDVLRPLMDALHDVGIDPDTGAKVS